MGIAANVGFKQFPIQGDRLGQRTKVCFHYDTKNTIMGTVVRDDNQEPWVTIIRLDDGRYVLATECMHSPVLSAGSLVAPKEQDQ